MIATLPVYEDVSEHSRALTLGPALYGYIVKYGEWYAPPAVEPIDTPPGAACFRIAWEHSMAGRGQYVEGLAFHVDNQHWVHHAWNIVYGRTVDLLWGGAGERYFGVGVAVHGYKRRVAYLKAKTPLTAHLRYGR